MACRSDARRALLAVLLAIWMSVQMLVIGVSPAWGFVLPHEHITRGALSEGAWQEHLREHRFGSVHAYAQRCDVPRQAQANAVMASVPDNSGTLSLFSFQTAHTHDTCIEIPALAFFHGTLRDVTFYIAHVSYAPFEPPPNV